jgi:hypothetical protein
MDYLEALLSNILNQFPLYIIYILGIIYAAIKSNKYPRVSLFVIIGIVILIIGSILFSSLTIWVQLNLFNKYSMTVYNRILFFINSLKSFIFFIGFFFIIFAVFLDREKK